MTTLFAGNMNLDCWPLVLVFFVFVIVAPVVSLLLSARSILNSGPLPTLLVFIILWCDGLILLYGSQITFSTRLSPFWRTWWWFGLLAGVALPLVLFQEGQKRDLFRGWKGRHRPTLHPAAAGKRVRSRRSS